MARKHNVDEVLRALKNKKDIRVSASTIYVLSNKIVTKEGVEIINPHKVFDLGNRSWGKIDFLTKYCGYHLVQTENF